MLISLQVQVWGGVVLLLLTLFQLATGMRWLKLGRRRVKVHRWSGIALTVLGLAHGTTGVMLAYGLG